MGDSHQSRINSLCLLIRDVCFGYHPMISVRSDSNEKLVHARHVDKYLLNTARATVPMQTLLTENKEVAVDCSC